MAVPAGIAKCVVRQQPSALEEAEREAEVTTLTGAAFHQMVAPGVAPTPLRMWELAAAGPVGTLAMVVTAALVIR